MNVMEHVNRMRPHLPRGVKQRLACVQRISTTVWIYVDTRPRFFDINHLRVFADAEAARAWFVENDPEGIAFECPVMKEAVS